MDRTRFETLLDAYGADFSRWPAHERAAAAVFAAQNGAEVAAALDEARRLDAALEQARAVPDTSALAARVLAMAPKRAAQGFDRRALMALAACAVFGMLVGYGGGLLAPPPIEDDAYFAMAFEAPMMGEDG